ncbi:hypothetical protein HYFRA_00014203 [Hymenoscyphus fraxineus]|uniref:Uncharacterized protein n=1 Tax=Hymenoscyphus fraxineus TaxID=746836 RepID=A0A9N9LDG9_9HELO|nr:hypothetical protein HYFRA_00014203 [Hymenoscyphus fraxineus]
MQFSTIFLSTALSASVFASPTPRNAPDGILNIFSDGGCVRGTECSRDFLVRTTDGCTIIPPACKSALMLITLNNNCSLAIYTDLECTSSSVITIDNTSVGHCENPSSTLGVGSLKVVCTV